MKSIVKLTVEIGIIINKKAGPENSGDGLCFC